MSGEKNKRARRPVRAGRFFTQKEIKVCCDYFEAQNPENKGLRKAEFFSKNLIEQLLSIKGCDGLRIYYGLAPENEDGKIDYQTEGNRQPRLFLVPVTVERDDEGNPTEKNKDQTFYLRVDTGKDGGDEFGGAGGGAPCPAFCNP